MDIPPFLLEMSKQMHDQDNRITADHIWQVRHKDYLVTEQGYSDTGFVITSDDSEIFRSWINDESDLYEYLSEYHPKWLSKWFESEDVGDGEDKKEIFEDNFGLESDDLPDDLNRVYVQEIEKIVKTCLTKADAECFIQRKQHDYPKLYTYVESMVFCPQMIELRNWILSLTD